jgi:hypothetical protein
MAKFLGDEMAPKLDELARSSERELEMIEGTYYD